MHKPITRTQPIEPHTSPSRQIIPSNLIITYGETYPRQLIHDVRHGRKLETFAGKVHDVATVCSCASLVFTLALVAIVGDRAAVELIGTFDVELDFDVGLKTAGRLVARWEGDFLGSEDCNCEMKGFAGDGVLGFFIAAIR